MKRRKDNSWEEEDNRDDRAFLKLEKEILKEMFPHSSDILEAEEEQVKEFEEKYERGGGSAILIENSCGKNYDENGGTDMLVNLDKT